MFHWEWFTTKIGSILGEHLDGAKLPVDGYVTQ